MASERIGRVVRGKWRLERLLGVGGMAAVYAATHRNGARVAIKMLHPTLSASTTLRDRFVREGYLANRVDHRGAVRVLDDDVDEDDAAFLVMDLVDGVTLGDHARDRTLSDAELLDVAEQVLDVLASAHQKGIVHRDLKPDNLLIDARGRVHVLDFGIARLLDDEEPLHATTTGSPFGTPGFMSPEQALGRRDAIGPRTDLYGLGASLFTLASGRFVHDSDNPQMLVVLAATRRAPSLASVAPSIAREVAAIVDRAMAYEPNDRFASARDMLLEVRRVRELLGLAPATCSLIDLYRASIAAPRDSPTGVHVASATLTEPDVRRARVAGYGTLALVAAVIALLTFGPRREASMRLRTASVSVSPREVTSSETPAISSAQAVVSMPKAAPPKPKAIRPAKKVSTRKPIDLGY